jgi:hypothetical protein
VDPGAATSATSSGVSGPIASSTRRGALAPEANAVITQRPAGDSTEGATRPGGATSASK